MTASAEQKQLQDLLGIASEYQDSEGAHTPVAAANQTAILKAIIADVSAQGIRKALDEIGNQRYQRMLPPVCVCREGEVCVIPVNFPDGFAEMALWWQLQAENSADLTGDALLSSEKVVSPDARRDSGFHTRNLTFDISLPTGCHQLKLLSGRGEMLAQMTLIVAQQQCYRQQQLHDEKKLFGFSAQLYTIRSARNWGMGDFTDLTDFVIEAANHGVDIVGLNPLHALFPANPLAFGPYSPSNRAFINVMYIDPQAVEEFQSCSKARQLVESDAFQNQLKRLRDTDEVDYVGVAERKFRVLELLFDEFSEFQLAVSSPRAQQFQAYLQEQGEALLLHATYDALHEHLLAEDQSCWGWAVWPAAYRHPDSRQVRQFQQDHASRISYFQYLQWLAFEQLKAAQDAAINAGMSIGIYLDLAVGTNPGGSEAWANQELFCFQANVGAPPDALASEGQDWGFPPFKPEALRQSAYQLFLKNLRANMVSAGAVRFDHCVSLLRLWWIPLGQSSKNGTYVHYNIEEITGILALESHRNQCMIVGEDLGTVPAILPKVMEDNAIYCYRVLYFEFNHDRMVAPEEYPVHAVATINTHDVAPLNSWWTASDIALRGKLGVINDVAQLAALQQQRGDEKQLVLNALHHYGHLPEFQTIEAVPLMTAALNSAIHNYLASSKAAVMISQLEDWMDMDTPVNVPGTFIEYPNWQRKLSQPLEGFFAKAENSLRLKSIIKLRRKLGSQA